MGKGFCPHTAFGVRRPSEVIRVQTNFNHKVCLNVVVAHCDAGAVDERTIDYLHTAVGAADTFRENGELKNVQFYLMPKRRNTLVS